MKEKCTSWQERMNSSRVTTPSLFLSIFCGKQHTYCLKGDADITKDTSEFITEKTEVRGLFWEVIESFSALYCRNATAPLRRLLLLVSVSRTHVAYFKKCFHFLATIDFWFICKKKTVCGWRTKKKTVIMMLMLILILKDFFAPLLVLTQFLLLFLPLEM